MTWTTRTEFFEPRRYGIIPCRRCAFFVHVAGDTGKCWRHAPVVLPSGRSELPVGFMHGGCGDGLLREEAAPLPEEPKP